MKNIFLLFSALTFSVNAQMVCKALFSYGAQFEAVSFINHSSASNAHYYWNFGDGTGSNFVNPTHKFHENGKYLVVLYVYDTLSLCSDFYEMWLNVTKYSTDICNPSIEDSVFYSHPDLIAKIIDNSINCEKYGATYGAPFGTMFNGQYPEIPNQAGNYIAGVTYYDLQTNVIKRRGNKTIPYYDRNKHYNACSANFEFVVLEEDSFSQTIKFTAMNKKAEKYLWRFVGFGDPIFRHTDTAIMNFGAVWQFGELNLMSWNIFLKVMDPAGCVDSLIQNITTIHKSNTYVGVDKNLILALQLVAFPNPIKDKISFAFPDEMRNLERVRLLNPLGQEILIRENFTAEEELSVAVLPKGMYFISVEHEGMKRTFRIVKE